MKQKKNDREVVSAVENQLRPAMQENTSKERIFGVYFDDKINETLIFKKIDNSEIRRYNEEKEIDAQGIRSLNLQERDLLIDMPSQRDFLENNESISDLEKLRPDFLDAIDEKNFVEVMNSIKRANDSIKPKNPPQDLIVEFLTLKIFDEKKSLTEKKSLNFYIKEDEIKRDGLPERTFRERIKNLYRLSKKEYLKVLSKPYFSYDENFIPSDSNDEKFLIQIIKVFQKRTILKAKNENFNQIIFNNFGDTKNKADKGQFFTPIPLVKCMISMLNPQENETLCDPCSGICDFLAMGFQHIYRRSEKEFPPANFFYGFDIEKNNLKLAELNLVLNGDGGAVLKNIDSLSQKMLENEEIINNGEFTTENYDMKTWNNLNDKDKNIRKFKIVATNPPFGKGRDTKTGAKGKWDYPKETIQLYETWEAKPITKKNGKIDLPNSMDKGVLFLENAYKILEKGGRMAIVLSNSIASIKEWENIRKWLIDRMRIVALFDMPPNTFGETGVSTTIIIAYKPKKNELEILRNDYEVFIREIKKYRL